LLLYPENTEKNFNNIKLSHTHSIL